MHDLHDMKAISWISYRGSSEVAWFGYRLAVTALFNIVDDEAGTIFVKRSWCDHVSDAGACKVPAEITALDYM